MFRVVSQVDSYNDGVSILALKCIKWFVFESYTFRFRLVFSIQIDEHSPCSDWMKNMNIEVKIQIKQMDGNKINVNKYKMRKKRKT